MNHTKAQILGREKQTIMEHAHTMQCQFSIRSLLCRLAQASMLFCHVSAAEKAAVLAPSAATTSANKSTSNNEVYCLTEVAKELTPYSPSSKTTSIQIRMGGRSYTVAVDDATRSIQLLDEYGQKISDADAPQYEFGTIENINQLSPDLLWVEGMALDHLVNIGSSPPELFNSRTYSRNRAPRSRLTGDQPKAAISVRSMACGYPKTFWGAKEQNLYLVRASGVTDLTPFFVPPRMWINRVESKALS